MVLSFWNLHPSLWVPVFWDPAVWDGVPGPPGPGSCLGLGLGGIQVLEYQIGAPN